MKLELKNSQDGIDLKKLSKKAGHFISKKEKYVLLLIFAIFLGYCGYLWYEYIYNYQWDDVKKQEFISAKKSNVAFDKEKFEKVLNTVVVRQEEFNKEIAEQRDIFSSKQTSIK